MAAGGIHGLLIHQHFQEWWGYGLFFLAATTLQGVYGLALLTDAINARDFGPRWRRAKRAMYVLGITGNLALIALYTVTRTVGIPFFGPEAGRVEPVAPIDVVSKVLETALIVLLAMLLLRRQGRKEGVAAG
jgi:hypothetical protein